MKKFVIASLFSVLALPSFADVDRNYYVADASLTVRFQAFNDGRNTYIEAVPGLIVKGATADGEQYIIKGVPSEVAALYMGKKISVIRGRAPEPVPEPVPEQLTEPTAVIAQAQTGSNTVSLLPVAIPLSNIPASALPPIINVVDVTAAKSAETIIPVVQVPQNVWPITTDDTNFRLLFEKWAKSTDPKWTVFWQFDRDFEIRANDEAHGDFKAAIRYVLKATRLSDTELQPCFHSNYVVRIVKKTTPCDPNKS